MSSENTSPSIHTLESGLELSYFPTTYFNTWAEDFNANFLKISYAARINILSSIKAAGSGHIGTSFSSIELILASRNLLSQWKREQENLETIFFSSKGHDAPAIYAAMHADGELDDSDLFKLRRLNGLPGHPEIDTPGIPTNTGSLGMGISKAKGFAYANRIRSLDSRIIVLLGDGELQEGQIWESLPGAARDNLKELTIIVDGNGIQSDTWVTNTSPLGNLKSRVEGSGWKFLECDGHDLNSLRSVINRQQDVPTFIFAKTIKGAGINSMMAFAPEGKFYKFHSGSLDDSNYSLSVSELLARMQHNIAPSLELDAGKALSIEPDLSPKARPESFVTAWSELLPKAMRLNSNLVVLDADLSYDTGTYFAREEFSERYIQAGIAEQDMVSLAGTLALSGFIPIVHSFATFMSMRPTEQIFNNLTERTRIIYCGFLAGLIPAAPGFSHQAVTDVGIFLSLLTIDVIEPSCVEELKAALDFSISNPRSTYIRVNSIGNPETKNLPFFMPGYGIKRREGKAIAIISSGTTMLVQALEAAKILSQTQVDVGVYSYPFLGSIPSKEFLNELSAYSLILVLENHLPGLGNFQVFRESLKTTKVVRMGVEEIPKNGRNDEVLAFHNLDAESIARVIQGFIS
jgi:transketolase